MGRNKSANFTMEEFKRFTEEAEHLNPDVYYSLKSNRILFSFDGKREIDIHGKKGIFYTKLGYLNDDCIKLGELINR